MTPSPASREDAERDVAARVPHLLRDAHDAEQAAERDEEEARLPQHVGPALPLRDERREARELDVPRAERDVGGHHQEQHRDEQLLHLRGGGGAEEVHEEEHRGERDAVGGHRERGAEGVGDLRRAEDREGALERERGPVEKPRHRPGERAEAARGEVVDAARARHGRGELEDGEDAERGDAAAEDVGDRDRGADVGERAAGQQEDAGGDHRADGDAEDVGEAERLRQRFPFRLFPGHAPILPRPARRAQAPCPRGGVLLSFPPR